MSYKLKPCPFCGGEAELVAGRATSYTRVICKSCEAETKTIYARVDICANDVAAQEWNRRYEPENEVLEG